MDGLCGPDESLGDVFDFGEVILESVKGIPEPCDTPVIGEELLDGRDVGLGEIQGFLLFLEVSTGENGSAIVLGLPREVFSEKSEELRPKGYRSRGLKGLNLVGAEYVVPGFSNLLWICVPCLGSSVLVD